MDISSEEEVERKRERELPNVLVTGTPGTGKTTLAELLVDMLGGQWRRLNVGDLVREGHFYDEVDPVHGAMLIDEDRLLDHMEDLLASGGGVVEHHGSDLFPERWFDLVVVLTCDNTLLFDRLVGRGYAPAKVQENVECEIMQVCLSEAQDSYQPSIIMVLPSDTTEQMQQNARDVVTRIRSISRQ